MDGWMRELGEERLLGSIEGIEKFEGLPLNEKLDLFRFKELS